MLCWEKYFEPILQYSFTLVLFDLEYLYFCISLRWIMLYTTKVFYNINHVVYCLDLECRCCFFIVLNNDAGKHTMLCFFFICLSDKKCFCAAFSLPTTYASSSWCAPSEAATILEPTELPSYSLETLKPQVFLNPLELSSRWNYHRHIEYFFDGHHRYMSLFTILEVSVLLTSAYPIVESDTKNNFPTRRIG